MTKRLSIAITVALCLLSTAALAQTCQEIHGLGTSGCAPSPYEGSEVTLSGIITVVPGIYNGGAVYFQCTSGGGMTLYDSALDGVVGINDEVTVTGIVSAYGSEIQLNSAVVLSLIHISEPTRPY